MFLLFVPLKYLYDVVVYFKIELNDNFITYKISTGLIWDNIC